MAAGLYGNACLLYGLQGLYIDTGRRNQDIAQSSAQLIVICSKTLFGHLLLKNLPHQRKAVAVNTG